MTKIKTLGAVMFMGGLVITFGAVGGMDTVPDQLIAQLATAASGLLLMFVGTRLIQD